MPPDRILEIAGHEIARRGWTIETRELDTKPWLADFIVPGNPQPSR